MQQMVYLVTDTFMIKLLIADTILTKRSAADHLRDCYRDITVNTAVILNLCADNVPAYCAT